MSTPELHADDLLDKESRGQLAPEERARLESHLAACSVCRFEREARSDFRAEFEADAQRSRDVPVRLGEASQGRTSMLQMRPRRSRVGMTLLLVAALLVAGVAAAELARNRLREPAPPPASGNASHVNGSASATHHQAKASAVAEPSATSADTAPAVAPPVLEPDAPTAPSKATPTSLAKPTTTPNVAESATGLFPVLVEPPAPSDGVASPPTASALFAEANQLREHGAYDDAVRSYSHLIDTYPQEPEALSARVMLGRLLLDRGEPQSALAQFDAYLRGGAGTLGEEAQLGRALALRKLGRASDEIQAWDALLAAHPNSVHAARARERLSELGAQ
jgi:TolA-binding protein